MIVCCANTVFLVITSCPTTRTCHDPRPLPWKQVLISPIFELRFPASWSNLNEFYVYRSILIQLRLGLYKCLALSSRPFRDGRRSENLCTINISVDIDSRNYKCQWTRLYVHSLDGIEIIPSNISFAGAIEKDDLNRIPNKGWYNLLHFFQLLFTLAWLGHAWRSLLTLNHLVHLESSFLQCRRIGIILKPKMSSKEMMNRRIKEDLTCVIPHVHVIHFPNSNCIIIRSLSHKDLIITQLLLLLVLSHVFGKWIILLIFLLTDHSVETWKSSRDILAINQRVRMY